MQQAQAAGTKLKPNSKYTQKQKCTCDSSGPVRSREGRTDGQTNNLNVRSGPVQDRTDGRTNNQLESPVRSGPGKDGRTNKQLESPVRSSPGKDGRTHKQRESPVRSWEGRTGGQIFVFLNLFFVVPSSNVHFLNVAVESLMKLIT